MPLRKKHTPTMESPSPAHYALIIFSLVLPYVGVALGLWGVYCIAHAEPIGWLLVACGVACVALDIWIDFVWAAEAMKFTDQPLLNKAGAELIGRTAIVAESIENGRGKVRIADSVWLAEGPDLPIGAVARIVAVREVVLMVDKAE